MWKCACGELNLDQYNSCSRCGKPRGGSIFASSEARINAPGAEGGYPRAGQVDFDSLPTLKGRYKGLLGRVAHVLGIILMVLLPLLVLLGFIFCRTELLTALPLTRAFADKAVWQSVFYAVSGIAAMLLSLLPGLWTCLLARKA